MTNLGKKILSAFVEVTEDKTTQGTPAATGRQGTSPSHAGSGQSGRNTLKTHSNMNNFISKTKTPGWWSEPKNIATAAVVVSVLAWLAYGFLTYMLPWLVKVTWSLVNLAIGGVVAGFLLMTVTSKKFWRAL